jgi:hypothetical protein
MNAIIQSLVIPNFFTLFFWVGIGIFMSLLLHTTGRDVMSENTPIRFSWQFFWKDNIKRIFVSFMLIYITLRFTPSILGIKVTDYVAFAIGFINDKLAQIIKDKTSMLTR